MRVKPIAYNRLARVKGRARADSTRADHATVQAYLPAPEIAAEAPSAEPRDGISERRQHKRVALNSTVTVRRLGAFAFEVALKDISAGGCRVTMIEPGVVGDPVIARLPQLEPLGSRLCWAEGTVTGMQFLRPIYPAVFDMLLARLISEPILA